MKKLVAFLLFFVLANIGFVQASQKPILPTPTTVFKIKATVTPTLQPTTPAVTPTPTTGSGPYPGAPLCAQHDNSTFHTLWNEAEGCHYDHEHGTSPFTQAVVDTFPGFDLFALLGNVEIGHTNPSSPTENEHKHGGFKWNVQLAHPQGCDPFEGSVHGVNGSVIQFHGFGDYAHEFESAQHSTVALLRQCNQADPTDYGYVFVNQLQTYGQIVIPYQGTVMPYPYYTVPLYNGGFGQYLTLDCIGNVPQCRPSRQFVLDRRLNTNSNWTSKITGSGVRPEGSTLFNLLWRVKDAYRLFDWTDQTYPYNFIWICSADGGLTYNPSGCRYNNSTPQVHEIAGTIPAAWDNLAGFDSNPAVGRITAEGFTDHFGALVSGCAAPGPGCHPIKLVNAFVGKYGSLLVYTDGKGTNIVPALPRRDIYFCNGLVCGENDPGAVPSGWIGPGN